MATVSDKRVDSLLHAIETIIIDWSHQIRDVLSKDSAQPLLDGSNPSPKVEFEFWSSRLVNLQCIHEQLLAPRVNKIAEILKKAKSCYWPALKNVFKEVSAVKLTCFTDGPVVAFKWTQSNVLSSQLSPYIDSVMYTVCLIWANSEHYNTPSRIIVILQEICNLLIEMDKEARLWEFPSSLVFTRMNSFLHRLKTIEELYVTAIEFLKLEKIELGGVRGNILGSMVFQIYEEVSELIKVFADCRYDPLDPAEEEFDEDFAEFQTKIQDLDRRLATIFSQGFNDCNSIESAVKQIHMFGSLLDRPLIKAEVSPHYSTLLEMFNVELDNAKIMYDAQIAATKSGGVPPISKNMPPVAGQLKWTLELQERLETPMKELQAIDHP
uniref:Dynein heavy chain tail domain-containing protein n=1 Tax=Gopherus agassizii TaxID=38772 RepID=A0A452J4J6_9SAUR